MTRWAVARDRRVTCSSLARPYPLAIRRARGSIVEDLDGNRYLDLAAGTACCPVGYAHPQVIRAVEEQARNLTRASGSETDSDPVIVLARRLTVLAPGTESKRVLLTANPAESVEAAVRMAMDTTRRRGVVIFADAPRHEGVGVQVASGQRAGMRRRPGAAEVSRFAYGDVAAVRSHLEETRARQELPAAILVEPMLTESHFTVPERDFLSGLRALCDEFELLLIMDETLTGMGRTGRMFTCEHGDVVPDMLLMAHGTTSGMPVCAVVAPERIMSPDWCWSGPGFSGNPMSGAAALATLDLLERNLVANAARLGPVLMDKLAQVAAKHACIASPRGIGLMAAVDVVRVRRSQLTACEQRDRVIDEAFRRGLLLLGCGERCIRFTPPLCINRVQLEVGLDVFEEAVATVAV
jgi:4-aminobutyrate aminotransferase